MVLYTETQHGAATVELPNVFHVPEAKVNFFSIKTAMDHGAQITFKHGRCFVSLQACMASVRQDGVLIINQDRPQHEFAHIASNNETV